MSTFNTTVPAEPTTLSRRTGLGPASRTAERPHVTPRQLQVLELVAEGFTTPQIAQELCVAPATVKTHLAQIYKSLGANDRANAVAVAMRAGLIE